MPPQHVKTLITGQLAKASNCQKRLFVLPYHFLYCSWNYYGPSYGKQMWNYLELAYIIRRHFTAPYIKNEPIQEVSKFYYLGIIIGEDRRTQTYIKCRIAKARFNFDDAETVRKS